MSLGDFPYATGQLILVDGGLSITVYELGGIFTIFGTVFYATMGMESTL